MGRSFVMTLLGLTLVGAGVAVAAEHGGTTLKEHRGEAIAAEHGGTTVQEHGGTTVQEHGGTAVQEHGGTPIKAQDIGVGANEVVGTTMLAHGDASLAEGTLSMVSVDMASIKVTSADGEMISFALDDQTKIMKAGKAVSKDALARWKGASVTVEYMMKDGKNLVTMIEAQ